ncbi:MAG: cytochrome c biogenesis protein CcsA [Coriobacteriales bacterium]|jgi:heme exporter protein C|nr:cytochrome c biogenesis protein CcsA [Coriobacteriales bacterium]
MINHRFLNIFDRLALPLLVTGGVLVTVAFVLAFTVAPLVSGDAVAEGFLEIDGRYVTNKLLLSQKIFYFHMPVAVVSMAALLFTAVYSILFLRTREGRYDLRARLATEISLVFVLMTMVSGELWERYEWGVWWTWEPRLTTYFILLLLVLGYFIVRSAVSDPERQAVYSSVLGIIVFIDVPICFMVTRLIPSGLHPVILRTDSGLPPPMLIPLLMALVGFACLAFALYRQRLRAEQLRERVEALKNQLDEATDSRRD